MLEDMNSSLAENLVLLILNKAAIESHNGAWRSPKITTGLRVTEIHNPEENGYVVKNAEEDLCPNLHAKSQKSL